MIVVFGKGHSGTRVLATTLINSGIPFPGKLNATLDLVPAGTIYDACRIFARYVRGTQAKWDFDHVVNTEVDIRFSKILAEYLTPVLNFNPGFEAGWKLPEATLIYPWLTRLYPNAKYIFLARKPEFACNAEHPTDNLANYGVNLNLKHLEISSIRALSWIYQYAIVMTTPRPDRFLQLWFEDMVDNPDSVRESLSIFLSQTIASISIDRSRLTSPPLSFSPMIQTLLDEIQSA